MTVDGDLVGAGWVTGGSDRKPSTLEITSEIDKARSGLAASERQVGELTRRCRARWPSRPPVGMPPRTRSPPSTNPTPRSRRSTSSSAGSARTPAPPRRSGSGSSCSATSSRRAGSSVEELGALEERLRNAQDRPTFRSEPVRSARNRRGGRGGPGGEFEARLAVRTAEERANAVRGRADSLRRAAAAEREARLRAQRARAAREHAAAVAAAVAESGRRLAGAAGHGGRGGARTRDVLAAERSHRAAALAAVRQEVNELNARIAALTDSLHRDEVAKAQAALRIEQLEQQALEQFGMATDDLVEEYGPHVPLPPTELEMAEYEQARERGEQVTAPAPMPFDRATQERSAKKADRELTELGRVNPLALEEFAALEERYNFLSTQLEDVKAARKDLLDVIADVDDRILQVFAEAYADVEREFSQVFATLFPGGEGRLLLTNPDDMLTTGIEVEARPPGKKIKRLSLLSGGEKSLTAVAMLVAIFRARPSPFYVMDEVEAALDDVNLRRLISLFEQLRERVAADRHHPPEADDGGRRRAVRRHHARRRHHHGDLPADARPAGRPLVTAAPT